MAGYNITGLIFIRVKSCSGRCLILKSKGLLGALPGLRGEFFTAEFHHEDTENTKTIQNLRGGCKLKRKVLTY